MELERQLSIRSVPIWFVIFQVSIFKWTTVGKKRSARGTSATFGLFAAAAVFRSVASGTRERRKRVVMERTRRPRRRDSQVAVGGGRTQHQQGLRFDYVNGRGGAFLFYFLSSYLPCAPTPYLTPMMSCGSASVWSQAPPTGSCESRRPQLFFSRTAVTVLHQKSVW